MSETKIIDGQEFKLLSIKSLTINGKEKDNIERTDFDKDSKIVIDIELNSENNQ